MKKFLSALSILILAMGSCAPLAAQTHVVPVYSYPSAGTPPVVILQCDANGDNCTPTSAANPLQTGGGGGGGGGAVTAASGSYVAGAIVDIGTGGSPGANTVNGRLAAIATNTAAATPAGENHIGEVGSNQTSIIVAQTVTAASAYATGNAVGGLITFTGAARVNGGGGLIQSANVSSASAQSTTMELWIFNASPSGSTCTDKTAFALAAADASKVVWVFSVGTWYSGGTASVGLSTDHAIPFAPSGTTLYGCLITRSTPTFTATTDIAVAIRTIRN